MTAKEFLSQIKNIDKLINAKLEEIKQLEQQSTSLQTARLGEKVKSSGNGDSVQRTIDKIVDMQAEINREIDRLVDLKAEVRDKIAKVYNPIFITVLTHIYINGLSLEKTAEIMQKEYRTICRWHGQALQVFRIENHMI